MRQLYLGQGVGSTVKILILVLLAVLSITNINHVVHDKRIMQRGQTIPTVHLNYVGHTMAWHSQERRGRDSVLIPISEEVPPPRPEDLPGYDLLLPQGDREDKACHICSDKNFKWPVNLYKHVVK